MYFLKKKIFRIIGPFTVKTVAQELNHITMYLKLDSYEQAISLKQNLNQFNFINHREDRFKLTFYHENYFAYRNI